MKRMFAIVALGAALTSPALAQNGGVNENDLFGSETPAERAPSEAAPPADAPARDPRPVRRRRGLNPSGEDPELEVRTGLSPREVKRELSPEEIAAEEQRREQAEAAEQTRQLTNVVLLFVGVFLLVLVLGGMAYAGFMAIFGGKSEDDAPEEVDPHAHLVQRDPTPAPLGGPQSGFRTRSATPAPVPRHNAPYPDTPASVPSRYPSSDPVRAGEDLISRAHASRQPILNPTATPAPMAAARTYPSPTPAHYVPPIRPGEAPKLQTPDAPAFEQPSGLEFRAMTPRPVPTPDATPVYQPPKETPVPTFSTTDSSTDTPPARTYPWDKPKSILDEEGPSEADDDAPTDHGGARTRRPGSGTPWTALPRDPTATYTPAPERKIATPPPMPWRTKGPED